MEIPKSQLNDKWLKASIVGGLWAAVEIIIGSFLHNLRIPMSGTILAANGVILMVAFHRHWGDKGLIWRAGLITALMKSVSPSAIILGPMIGILMEAMLLEFAVRVFGRNAFGYILGGVLAISGVLVHKAVSLLILYGFSIVDVYSNLFQFAARQVHIRDADPWVFLAVLQGLYILVGIAAAITGMSLSGRVKADTQDIPQARVGSRRIGIDKGGATSFSIPLLIAHLLIIPLILWMLSYSGSPLRYIPAAIYIVFVFIRYPNGFRRVRKPVFWVQLLILTLLAGLFYSGIPGRGHLLSTSGLFEGLDMSLRAIFIVASFSGFSAELANPLIRSWLSKRGMRPVYQSMELAFESLPHIIDALPRARTMLFRPALTFSILIRKADQMVAESQAAGHDDSL